MSTRRKEEFSFSRASRAQSRRTSERHIEELQHHIAEQDRSDKPWREQGEISPRGFSRLLNRSAES